MIRTNNDIIYVKEYRVEWSWWHHVLYIKNSRETYYVEAWGDTQWLPSEVYLKGVKTLRRTIKEKNDSRTI